ncbi:4-hydroxy-tetrahydrodipicolinate synthase [Pseudoroseomonas cervicalis]|nr:4-hydroxy-tetrahydrodipicolinate synthase [Pseudoroseomonas cervicalis]
MFKGSLVALITPLAEDGALDPKAFQDFVAWQIAEGTNGLVPVGTTGESPTLSHAEHHRVVELCVEAAGGRVPVIAGAGSNSTAEAIELTRHAKAAGADAALVVTPYYNKPTQEGLYLHFMAIADAVDLPIIIYNIPPRSVIDMSVETMARLARHPNIVGVKDATANLTRPLHTRLACGTEFCQLSGEDPHRARLPRRRRGGLHQRHRQCRAAPLRRDARGLGGRQHRGGHGHPGPADAAA